MLQAPTCKGKNSLIIPIKQVLRGNAQKDKKSQQVTHRNWARQRVKYEKTEAVKVQRGKERVMMSRMRCPGENPRIPQTRQETLEDQPPQRAQHGTAAHASRSEGVDFAALIVRHQACLRRTVWCTSTVWPVYLSGLIKCCRVLRVGFACFTVLVWVLYQSANNCVQMIDVFTSEGHQPSIVVM